MLDLAQEVRVLNVATELVEAMVNPLLCCFHENDRGLVTEAKPRGITEKRYFFVLLLEMLAPVNGELVPAKRDGESLLALAGRISQRPELSNHRENARRIGRRGREFTDWLAHEFTREIYSENLRENIQLTISRNDALYLVGNRCKHSLVRSNRLIQRLVTKYRESGVQVPEGEETLILKDIDNWFLDDFCLYHFTKICELCSNLYHAIIEYVRPEEQVRRRGGGSGGSYEVPPALTRTNHISEFYELFNRVRNPWVPIIETDPMLKLRY